jgi:1-hydroxycarotenoid 3,4-desaturase
MLISHVEREGVWLVDGGMQRLADALERVAAGLGVEIRYGQGARRILIDNGRAVGAELETGETMRARSVIVNAGAEALGRGLLGEAAAGAGGASVALPRSLSAVTWALDAPTSGFPLERHNVFFSSDYAREFDEILRLGRLPSDPTIYVCAQDRGTVTTPLASERLLVLINAPPNGDERALGEEELKTCETEVFDRLARCGLRVDRRDAPQTVTTPQDFNRLFPGTGGALYGAATSGWSAAFQRPGAATRIAGLYLAGGGAHPGAGVPMAALSGRLAALRAMKDFVSTVPSRRAATRGGMSTPSARTAASD